ncbi:MAG: gamma-glutamyltransferase [Planctomycetaceae bacterium]
MSQTQPVSETWSRTRPCVGGREGAVACGHPLAAQAGLDMLRSGGNAVDAAIAMAVAVGVVEPYMSGVGGNGLMLIHLADGTTTSLNFTGYAPQSTQLELLTPENIDVGPRASMVPGNIAGWCMALEQYGTKSRQDVFAPAVSLAEDGFPLLPFNVRMIESNLARLNPAGSEVFNRPPIRIGAMLKQTDLARTLTDLAQVGSNLFYKGGLGKTIAEYIQSQDGFLSAADLAGFQPEWQPPVSVTFRDCEVVTCAPNCEGFQILQTLKLLEPFELAKLGHNSAAYVHLLTEAMKLAVADRIAWSGDPRLFPVPVEQLLADDYINRRRRFIDEDRASFSEGERPARLRPPQSVPAGTPEGMTTHMAAVDAQGNSACITQSFGNGFGSGVMIPGTGLLLNNFIWWTEIDPEAPPRHQARGGQQWSCCMSPLQVFRGGKFWFSISTPGSWGILQTTVQMLLNVIEFGMDPQLAIDAPRFRLWEGTRIQMESRFDAAARAELTARGHQIEDVPAFSHYVGGGQAVMIDQQSGARLAGADPRRDGYALAY